MCEPAVVVRRLLINLNHMLFFLKLWVMENKLYTRLEGLGRFRLARLQMRKSSNHEISYASDPP